MIRNLRRKTVNPGLDPAGVILHQFSGDGQAYDWVSIDIKGYFRVGLQNSLEFEVINRPYLHVREIGILNGANHEIRIVVEDTDNPQPMSILYHLDTDFDANTTFDWSITYHVEKSNRRRTWKMTKAQAGVPPKK